MKKILTGLLVFLVVLSPVFAHCTLGLGYHMFWPGYGQWIYGSLMMFLFWGGLIFLVVYFIKNSQNR